MSTSDRPALVGIDLGTTHSLVAILDGDRPRVLPNALGEVLTPSAVGLADDGSLLVGAAARARLATHPESTVTSFKRDMGTDRRYDLGARTFTPVELSALVLASLKRDAEVALGRPVEEAVVTVPAYFGDLQRQATRDAGTMAGLRVERIINEPTAAALAYGLHERGRELRIAVLDLGGGTFDVTVLEIVEGIIEIQASSGDARLGGDDFDLALAAHVAEGVPGLERLEALDAKGRARLLAACGLAKERLSEEERARVIAPEPGLADCRRLDVALEVSREGAEAAWAALLERIRAPVVQALRDASLRPEEVDEVLLVGGATRMPCVQHLAARIFGRLPLRSLPPDEAVALGAGIQAALKDGHAAVDDLVVTDVAPFSLGISAVSGRGRARASGLFAPIIERGTVIPVSRVRSFFTVADQQTRMLIEVFQGEHATCEENQRLGEYVFDSVPPDKAGAQRVDVRFSYDINGILEVEMTLAKTGRLESFVIEERPGALTPEEIAAARKRLEAHKLHPRDALPNTTALARADALYVELRGELRDALGEAIAAFQAALEAQDPQVIEEVRATLNGFVKSLRARG